MGAFNIESVRMQTKKIETNSFMDITKSIGLFVAL